MTRAPNLSQPGSASGIVRLLRELTPPLIVRVVRHLYRWRTSAIRFTGNYPSWDKARACSTGYDSEALFTQVRKAAEKACDGRAAFERDGIAFDRLEYPFALLASLLHVAAAAGNRLRVLDFGGSLGSTFFQCRAFLSCVPEVLWCIVEQPHFVECGRQEFSCPVLRFYPSIEDCLAENVIDVVLLSSVLQYLPNPDAALAEIEVQRIPWLLIDRTPLVETPHDRLCVQQVPASLYGFPVSYPAWLFGRRKFLDRLAKNWSVILDVVGEDGALPGPGFEVPFRLLLCRAGAAEVRGSPDRGSADTRA